MRAICAVLGAVAALLAAGPAAAADRERADVYTFADLPQLVHGVTGGSGLISAETAEIDLVVRSHGPRIPRLVGEMTRTFHAGCDYSVFGGPIEQGSYGPPGPNSCTDLQLAVHP